MTNRHEQFNLSIVNNLRDLARKDDRLSNLTEDQLYWVHEAHISTNDFDDDSKLGEYVAMGLWMEREDRKKFTFEESMARWEKWRETH